MKRNNKGQFIGSGTEAGNYRGGKPKCLDCNKQIDYGSKRCLKCNGKIISSFKKGTKQPWAKKNLGKGMLGIKRVNTWMLGENHPNWKGNSTEDYRERRRFREIMQKLIFNRDNYQCQICESKQDLQVDHIQSWAEFKELRFEPENCRTLCAKCHYKITFKREMPETTKAWGHNLTRRQIL